MKKYYRIFIVNDGDIKLLEDSKYNWFDAFEDAEAVIEDKLKQRNVSFRYDFTILPVYCKPSDY